MIMQHTDTRRFVLLTLVVPVICFSSACPAGINIYAPPIQALKNDYLEKQAKQKDVRLDQLHGLVRQNIASAEKMLKTAKTRGNISGMAVTRKWMSIFKRCTEELETTGNFKLPTKVRRELASVIVACKQKKTEVEEAHTARLAALERTCYERFVTECGKQAEETPGDEELKQLFHDLISGRPPAQPSSGEGEVEKGEVESGRDSQPDTSKEPTVIAASGEGEEWAPIARWFVEVHGLGMFQIPVMNRFEAADGEGESILGESYKTRYEPLRILSPGGGYVFRAKTIRGEKPVEIVEWPSEANSWTILVRARPGEEAPSKHGFEFQASFPGATELPFVGPTGEDAPVSPETDKARATVKITVKTRPAGAVVYVDRRLYRPQEGPHRTPCEVALTAGTHDIVLKKLGYRDGVINQFEATEGRTLAWVLQKDPSFISKTVIVSAKSVWCAVGIDVKEGDCLVVSPAGTWSCGRKREKVDSEGYPNNEHFFHYYLDPKSSPRQFARANYGALLMRIGEDGGLVPVGRKLRIKAERSGRLHFDINEKDDGRSRRDNTGSLTLRIQKWPGGPGVRPRH